MEDFLLKDIRHEYHKDERICDWEYLEFEDDCRVFFKPSDEKGMGFNFYAVEKIGHHCNEHTEKNKWDENYCMVECLFNGIAYFDGIRHLYYGDKQTDNYGYHYYAGLERMIGALKILRQLEARYCRDI